VLYLIKNKDERMSLPVLHYRGRDLNPEMDFSTEDRSHPAVDFVPGCRSLLLPWLHICKYEQIISSGVPSK